MIEFKRSVYWLVVGGIVTLLLIVFVVSGWDIAYTGAGEIEGIEPAFDYPGNQAAAWSAGIGILGTLFGVFVGSRVQRTEYRVVLVKSEEFPASPTKPNAPETQATQTAAQAASEIEMSPHEEAYLTDYFIGLTETIYSRALQIADLQGRRDKRQTKDIAQACAEIAPGRPFPESIGQRITSSITGITVISAILAVIFGAIGFFGLGTLGAGSDTVQPFIDIAQIFAGAVVGSTGAAAVAGR